MSLKLDTNSAKAADSIASAIRESGKYIGTITRAEKLVSKNGTEGIGLSFRASDGSTADYLDIYYQKGNGETLAGLKTVNAIMACLKLREAKDGRIRFERWNKDARKREPVEADGYPDLMGKRIGLLLQKELASNQYGEDVERMLIFGVFSAETELTASEILDGKTNPERLAKMVEALAARPVRDSRDKGARSAPRSASSPAPAGFDDEDDIPF